MLMLSFQLERSYALSSVSCASAGRFRSESRGWRDVLKMCLHPSTYSKKKKKKPKGHEMAVYVLIGTVEGGDRRIAVAC